MVTSLLLAVAFAGFDKLQPIDEGPKDKQFVEFRTNMIAAIKKKNYKYVQSRIDEKIHWSFGGGEGKKEMMEEWAFLKSEAAFYSELLQVLQLGGQFNMYGEPGTDTFTAPYSFSAWPDEYDAFEYRVAVQKNVSVYAKPDKESKKVGTLSYDIVKRNFNEEYEEGWYPIYLPDGSGEGWAQDGPVRSPIDYRAIFVKKRGSWYMTVFIAGD